MKYLGSSERELLDFHCLEKWFIETKQAEDLMSVQSVLSHRGGPEYPHTPQQR